ncbi:primase-helicase zinc-binding domain-containing protein [Helicobacter sp. UBA3407]|uniref:primase-helicase zinc-binding domain-containing protein n=1 Tax=Helicobacter TaxID=209 RepID=UPI002634679C|nr:primase-helicase zinc-binding domain-containing protein [Helicobacter sp. UBA3407]
MTQDYKQSCKSVVDEFLKNATRFDFSEYEILDYNEFLYSFKIKVINELDIESKYKILTGLHKGNSGDFFFTDEESLRNKMSIYLKAEINDSKNLDLLKSLIQDGGFATFKKDKNIREIEPKFYYSHICKECDGDGEVVCDNCGGGGKVSCHSCSGSGKKTCNSCNGSGRTRFVFNGESRIVSCNACGGSGKNRCSDCQGSGKNICNVCRGSGDVICEICDGEGHLTDVYTIFLYAKPDYTLILQENTQNFIKEALQKTLLYNMDSFGSIKRLTLTSDERTKQIKEVYESAVPFATFSIRLNDSENNFILYGRDAEIFDAGGILDKILQADLNRLVKSAQFTFANPFAPFVFAIPLKMFLKSEKNMDIISHDALHRGKTLQEALDNLEPSDNPHDTLDNRVNKCYELLGRTFSKDYIQTTLQTLPKAISRINRISQVNWFVLAFFVSVFMVILNRVGIFYSSQKSFTFKDGNILYLNPSIYNANGLFDLNNFINLIAFMPFIWIIFIFVCILGIGIGCNKLYWKFIGSKIFHSWILVFCPRHRNLLLVKSLCGYFALCLFFYLCPMYFKNEKLYGIFAKEETLQIYNATKIMFEVIGVHLAKFFALVFEGVSSLWQFLIGLFLGENCGIAINGFGD